MYTCILLAKVHGRFLVDLTEKFQVRVRLVELHLNHLVVKVQHERWKRCLGLIQFSGFVSACQKIRNRIVDTKVIIVKIINVGGCKPF